MPSREFTLISRSYCHLCSEMEQALTRLKTNLDFSFAIVDVDADPQLVDRYNELVPVLLDEQGRELCHYFLDAGRVREAVKSLG